MDYNLNKERTENKPFDEEEAHNNLVYQRNLIEIEKIKILKQIHSEMKKYNKNKNNNIFGGL